MLAVDGRVNELVKVVARRADLADDAVRAARAAASRGGVVRSRSSATCRRRSSAVQERARRRRYRHGRARRALEPHVLASRITDVRRDDRGGQRRWSTHLVGILERKIELTADLTQRQALRRVAASVFEHQLTDIYQAIGQLNAVLDDDAGDATALAELDRIYTKERMWPELLDVVDRRALLAISAKDRADLAFRAAQLVETELSDVDAAVPRYGAVLTVLASHPGARAALEAVMAHDDHVDAATPLLERVYRADRDAAGLVRVYERRLATVGRDAEARRADWTALADVHETIAQQPATAFAVWGRALAADPEDLELLAPLTRLADSESLWPQLATLLDERLAAGALPAEVEQAFATKLGQVAEDRLADLDRAARGVP